jgi:signal transduction histidine kinase
VKNIVRNTVRLLRGLYVFRLLVLVFGVLVLAIRTSIQVSPEPIEIPTAWSWLLLPSLAALVYLFVPGLSDRLGRYYLPIALALSILSLSLESSGTYLFRGTYVRITLPTGRELSMAWAPTEMILLVLVPCVLSGAAYGLVGALQAASFAVVLHLGIGLAILLLDGSLHSFLVLLPLRVAVLYAFPVMTGYLSDTWRREHDALQVANQRLRGFAATAEHLATSRERVRLARAMHDTLAHSLSALTVQLEALDTLLDKDRAAAQVQLNKIRHLAREGLEETRHAILDLRSSPVEELGLAGAIERLVERFGKQNGIETAWTLSGEPYPLLPVQANALYRIVEEGLDNVERHAQADRVAVGLTYDGGVTLNIQDNGQGFDPDTVHEDRYGLLGIRERATLIDGQVTLDTTPGQGTTLLIEIDEPWKE